MVEAKELNTCIDAPQDGLDYSGVVIAVTLAPENELKKHFFSGYKSYLEKTFGLPNGQDKAQRPRSMRCERKCLLNMHPEATSIPIGRIIDKLNFYLNRNDYAAAERHLGYWLSEADVCHDMRGKLTVLNEQIGLFRKTGKDADCLAAIADALALADSLHMEQSVTYGTTLINAATGYKAFGKAADALPLYRKAQSIYESALEVAITRLNIADLIAARSGLEDGAEEIEKQLLEAEKLLDTEALPRDGYFAVPCRRLCRKRLGTLRI